MTAAPAPTAAALVEQITATRRALLRIRDRDELLVEACRIAVEVGGFRMAWVGWVDDDGGIVPVASAGEVDGYLDDIRITVEGSTGEGPSGRAIASGRPVVCHDIAADPAMSPWRAEALARGYRSSGAFPLRDNGNVLGMLGVYADAPGCFDEHTEAQLQDLANDLAIALLLLDEQQARLLAEQRYRRLFEHAAEGIFRTGVDGEVLEANPAMARILGYVSPEELQEMVPHARALYVDPAQRDQLLEALRTSGEVHDHELRQRRKDGTQVWLSVTARLLTGEDGEPEGLEGLAVDISARKRAELEVRRREAILAAVSDVAEALLAQGEPWAMTIDRELGRLASAAGADRAGVIEVVQRPGEPPVIRRPHSWSAEGVDSLDEDPRLDGLAFEEAGYGPWAEALAAGEVLSLRTGDLGQQQRALLEEFGTKTLLFAPIHVDGGWWGAITLESVGSDRAWSAPEVDALEAAARVLGAAIAQERALGEIQARDRRLHDLVEAVPLGITFVDATGQLTFANERAEQVLRLDRSSIAGRTYDDPAWRITAFDGGPFPASELPFARVAAEHVTVRDVQHAVVHDDGTRTELSINGVPLFDGDGAFSGMVATVEDITSRRAAELTRSRLAAIVESSSDAIIAKTVDGVTTDWNAGAVAVYGHTAEEAVGRHVSLVVPESRLDELADVHARVLTGETVHVAETERVRGDGEGIWVSLVVSPLRDGDGEVIGMSTIGRDVTEQVLARQELARYAEELERSNHDLEQFAYVASHDLQEPLRMVTSFLQLLARRYEGQLDEQADTYIGFAVDGATRMRRLIEDLLAYSRVGTRGGPLELTALGEVVGDVLSDLSTTIDELGATVDVGPLPVVEGDASQLSQVFLNLVGNGLKFHNDHPPHITIRAERGEEAWTITVTDDGIGIPPDQADRVFIIFQRLHARDEYPGTGIGLAICKKIVERHGGRIWIGSDDQAGTTVRFTIPLAQEEQP